MQKRIGASFIAKPMFIRNVKCISYNLKAHIELQNCEIRIQEFGISIHSIVLIIVPWSSLFRDFEGFSSFSQIYE